MNSTTPSPPPDARRHHFAVLPTSVPLDVRCPRCEGRATFEEPFEFISGKAAREMDPDDPRPVHRWGGWMVREKFPSVARWKAPRGSGASLWWGGCPRETGGYRLLHRGVVRCSACHFVGLHVLRWPADAFFAWSIRGTRLWAWSAEHARVLLHYVGALQRDPGRFPGYRKSLEKLPAAILAARSRATVTRKIRESLERAGESTDPPAPNASPARIRPGG
ncbi:MAG TPA: hypothetical protein VFR81_29225 [Longimicrobium sp.]|nr:hypothetical protein [Longimicrobium sp.]